MKSLNAKIIGKKLIILLLSFVIMSFGVAFSIKAALGTSPISSLPYVTGQISGLSVGTTTIILHCLCVLLQIILLRKNYQLFQLTQLAVAVVFGTLTDFAVFCIKNITVSTYLEQVGLCVIGILLIGLGISLEVEANLTVIAGEGLVIAITRVFHTKFGNTKIAFDVTLVATSIVLSLLAYGKVIGVREGTVAAALLVGQITKFFQKHSGKLKEWINR